MIVPTAKIRRSEQRKIRTLFTRIVKKGKAKLPRLVAQATIWAAQSAGKATGPGTGQNVNRLKDVNKFRPVVKMPEDRYWYVWKKTGSFGGGGNFFRKDKPLGIKSKRGKQKRIMRVKYGIQFWNKRKNTWDYIPVLNGEQNTKGKKYRKNTKVGRIPNAGAAKYGWLGALNEFGKSKASGNIRNPRSRYRVQSRKRVWNKVTNMVDWTKKIAPNSAGIAIQKTRKRLYGFWWPKLGKELVNK